MGEGSGNADAAAMVLNDADAATNSPNDNSDNANAVTERENDNNIVGNANAAEMGEGSGNADAAAMVLNDGNASAAVNDKDTKSSNASAAVNDKDTKCGNASAAVSDMDTKSGNASAAVMEKRSGNANAAANEEEKEEDSGNANAAANEEEMEEDSGNADAAGEENGNSNANAAVNKEEIGKGNGNANAAGVENGNGNANAAENGGENSYASAAVNDNMDNNGESNGNASAAMSESDDHCNANAALNVWENVFGNANAAMIDDSSNRKYERMTVDIYNKDEICQLELYEDKNDAGCLDINTPSASSAVSIFIYDSEPEELDPPPTPLHNVHLVSSKQTKRFVASVYSKTIMEFCLTDQVKISLKGYLPSIRKRMSTDLDVMNSIHTQSVSRISLERLIDDNQSINEEPINFMFQLFSLRSFINSQIKKDHTDFFVSSNFTSYLFGRNGDEYNPQIISQWLFRSPFPNFFAKYKRLFFPMYIENMSHWTLLIIDFYNNEIIYIDPKPSLQIEFDDHPCTKMLNFMEHLSELSSNTVFVPRIWTLVKHSCPRLVFPNQHSEEVISGIFITCIADTFSAKVPKFYESFDLSSEISLQKMKKKSIRAVILSLILSFKKDNFKSCDSIAKSNDPSDPNAIVNSPSKNMEQEPTVVPDIFISIDLDDNATELTPHQYESLSIFDQCAYLSKSKNNVALDSPILDYMFEDPDCLVQKKIGTTSLALERVVEQINDAFPPTDPKTKDHEEDGRLDEFGQPILRIDNSNYSGTLSDDESSQDSYMKLALNNISTNEDKVSKLNLFGNSLRHHKLFDIGFRMYIDKPSKVCVCPCSQLSLRWQRVYKLDSFIKCKNNNKYTPNGLLAHCAQFKDTCYYHSMTEQYLRYLYQTWWEFDSPSTCTEIIHHRDIANYCSRQWFDANKIFNKYAGKSVLMYKPGQNKICHVKKPIDGTDDNHESMNFESNDSSSAGSPSKKKSHAKAKIPRKDITGNSPKNRPMENQQSPGRHRSNVNKCSQRRNNFSEKHNSQKRNKSPDKRKSQGRHWSPENQNSRDGRHRSPEIKQSQGRHNSSYSSKKNYRTSNVKHKKYNNFKYGRGSDSHESHHVSHKTTPFTNMSRYGNDDNVNDDDNDKFITDVADEQHQEFLDAQNQKNDIDEKRNKVETNIQLMLKAIEKQKKVLYSLNDTKKPTQSTSEPTSEDELGSKMNLPKNHRSLGATNTIMEVDSSSLINNNNVATNVGVNQTMASPNVAVISVTAPVVESNNSISVATSSASSSNAPQPIDNSQKRNRNQMKNAIRVQTQLLAERFGLHAYLERYVIVHSIDNDGIDCKIQIKFISCGHMSHSMCTVNDIVFTCILPDYGFARINIVGKARIDEMIVANNNGTRVRVELPINLLKYANKKRKKKNTNNNTSNYNNSLSRCLEFDTINKSLYIIYVTNVQDNSSHAPILPPDEIYHDSKDHSFENLDAAKAFYNSLLDKVSNRRNYVPSAYHVKMFNKQYIDIIDWRKIGDTNIVVSLNDGSKTHLKIRMGNETMTNNILLLHRLLKSIPSNANRKGSGDKGKMIALGYRSEKEGEYKPSEKNEDIKNTMKIIGSSRNEWFQTNHKEDYDNNFNKDIKLEYMKESLSDFMVHSTSLCNSSHYDCNDASITVATWVEETLGNTENWYLVFPNVTKDFKKAIVIQLFHGCCISWDAKLLRHASSKPTYRIRGGGTSAGNCELRRKNRNRNTS